MGFGEHLLYGQMLLNDVTVRNICCSRFGKPQTGSGGVWVDALGISHPAVRWDE